MKKILLLGGTRFVGKKVVELLQSQKAYEIFVASRREVNVENFIKFDRKNSQDLERIFSQNAFDVIVDFINFSALDSEILLLALNKYDKKPHLISISTIYTYSRPEDVTQDKTYKEEDFDPKKINPELETISGWDYTKGKRAMEAFISQNYPSNKSTVIRFPIILGEDDYTKRAYFFQDIISKEEQFSFSGKGKSSNYIFSTEAAEAISCCVSSEIAGTYNVALPDALNEEEIFEMYCEFYHEKPHDILDKDSRSIESPFYYKKNFLVDCSKFQDIHRFKISFRDALYRELKLMQL